MSLMTPSVPLGHITRLCFKVVMIGVFAGCEAGTTATEQIDAIIYSDLPNHEQQERKVRYGNPKVQYQEA